MATDVGLRVVSFNAQHGRTPGGAVDTAALASACASFDADVLALQEMDVRVPRSRWADQVATVARSTGLREVFAPARRIGLLGLYGNALVVRGGLDHVERVTLPRTRGRERRTAVLASVTVAARTVSVAATHLSIDPQESEVQLAALVHALSHWPRPWLLLGDLNRHPEQLRTLTAAGFDVADTSAPTFPAHAPRIRIDHVAVAGLEIRCVDVLPAAPVSDHRPLAVTLAWDGEVPAG